MKKVLCGIAAMAMMAMGACSCDKANDGACATELSKEFTDSVSQIYGKMVGGYVLNDYLNFSDEMKNEKTREDMIRGIRLALSQGNNEGVSIGMQVGVKILQEIQQFEEMGMDLDANIILGQFIEAFKEDSVNMIALRTLSNSLSNAMSQARVIKHQKELDELANSPEAQQNAISGKAFLDKKRAEEGVKATESGLIYTVEVAGNTSDITDNAPLNVIYKGMLIDGTVFDQRTEAVAMAPGSVVPGFGEGMKLIGKGGKGTLYIPAELAYGVEAPAVIGPNQVLVFEIEIEK